MITAKPSPKYFIHKPIIAYFPRYRGKYAPCVGTATYRCKIQAVRAEMRLSIAVEHPGDLLLTITEFFQILRFRAEKN